MQANLYIVAVPQGKLLEYARHWQERLEEKYNLYEGKLPPIHLTIEAFNCCPTLNLTEVINQLTPVISDFNQFAVTTQGFMRFPSPYKAIGFNIQATPELVELHTKCRQHLLHLGLRPRPIEVADVHYHMTLVGATFGRDWSLAEFEQAWEWVKDEPVDLSCLIDELQLWFPRYQPFVEAASSWKLKAGI